MNNPILLNYRSKAFYAGIVIIMIIVQMLFVFFNTRLTFEYSLIDSIVFNVIFAFCIIPLWYPVYYIRWKDIAWYFNVMTHGALIMALLSIWLGVGFLFMNLILPGNAVYHEFFIGSLPWKIVQGIFLYIIITLVYFFFLVNNRLDEAEENTAQLRKRLQTKELDRIAVKDRQQIHIIPILEIDYIEACGDYVSIHTAAGVFLKEKTMKYFEENLSARQFVRIHRSYIVNVNSVVKIELYEKESYNVHLKNAKVLKASAKGYKALKEIVKL